MRRKQQLAIVLLVLSGVAAGGAGLLLRQAWLGGLMAAMTLAAGACWHRRGSVRSKSEAESSLPTPSESRIEISPPAGNFTAVDDDHDDAVVSQLLSQNRFALLLRPQIAATLDADQVAKALDELDKHMSLVPTGDVLLRAWRYEANLEMDDDHGTERVVAVQPLYLDRFTVTNREFFEFVTARGYEQIALWDEDVLPAVLGFVDRTGRPGPRFWQDGHYPVAADDQPVVGICWYEAAAFARWVGKRLPTDAEWVKAAAWPVSQTGGRPVQRKFPWGDEMDRRRANVWGSTPGRIVPVHEFSDGVSVGGAYQLIGNVWEWTASGFGNWTARTLALELATPMKSIRGGAFDTYFDNHANCNFQSGESPLARKHNIGFRCALRACDVQSTTVSDQPSAVSQLQESAC